MPEKIQMLEEILNQAEGKVLLLDHEFSDPDGFASKYTWAYIIKEMFRVHADIGYSKEIGNNTTQALMKKFSSFYNEEMKRVEDTNLDEYALIFLLDVNLNSNNSPFTEAQKKNLDYNKIIMIDHHGVDFYHRNNCNGHKNEQKHGKFEDIIEDGSIGSTCTRTIEYLKAYGLKFSSDKPEHNLLATALWIGIETDSRGKLPAKRDMESLAYVIDSASRQIKDDIDRRPRPEQAQRALGHALGTYDKIGPYAIATLGRIEPDYKDIIAITAEELLKAQGIEASIAWALVGKDTAMASIRTKEESPLSAGDLVNLYNDNIFQGGGRPNAAGFKGSMGILENYLHEDEDSLVKMIHKIIVKRIKDKIKEK